MSKTTDAPSEPGRWELGAKTTKPKPKPRLVIHGEPGIGKTKFGASPDKAIMIAAEDGASGADIPRLPTSGRCQSWEEILMAARMVKDGDHDFDWVAVDTGNAAERLLAEHICKRDFKGLWNSSAGKEGFNAWGAGDKAVGQEFQSLLALLDGCQERGMGVIVLCHTGLHRQANALGMDFQKFGAAMGKWAWQLTCSWADQVAMASRDMRASVKDGERKGKATAIGSERWMIFEGGPAIDAKSRVGYEMPDRIPFSWESYATAIEADPVVTLTDKAAVLIGQASEETLMAMQKKVPGDVTKEKLMGLGRAKLDALNNWLLVRAANGR